MAKTETKKSNWGSFGGSTKMHAFAPTGTQEPGHSSQEGHSGSRKGIEPKAGPSNVMGYSSGTSNKSYAGCQTPGQSSSMPSGGDAKFAAGGKGHMCGNTGSQKQTPA